MEFAFTTCETEPTGPWAQRTWLGSDLALASTPALPLLTAYSETTLSEATLSETTLSETTLY